jgi:hypothetical protein
MQGELVYIPKDHLEKTEIRPTKIWMNFLNKNVLVNRLSFLKKM